MKTKLIASLIAGAIFFVIASKSYATGGAFETMQDFRISSPDGKRGHIYVERGWTKERAGDFRGAIADYSAAIAIEPKSGDARYYRALLYSAMGRFIEAIADLDVVIKDTPKSAGVYLVRGDAHAGAGHTKEALADYDSAIRNATNSADGDLVQAKAWAEKGDFARAGARYDQARHRSPRDDNVLNGFAWFKATCLEATFRNGPEAVQIATKACELTKWKEGNAVDTLAAAYAESGDFTQAIKYQIQALAIRPPDAPDSLENMQRHLRAYQAHKPFRERPKLRKSSS